LPQGRQLLAQPANLIGVAVAWFATIKRI